MDLIDRQYAIDKFESWLKVEEYNEGERNMLKGVLYELRVMPSAQPEKRTGERTETHACYLIKIQDAIDAIVNCTNCGDEKTLREYVAMHNLENMWSGGVLEALDAVKDLPSAQPEHTCVNCGRTVNNGGWYADGRTCLALYKDGYDSIYRCAPISEILNLPVKGEE